MVLTCLLIGKTTTSFRALQSTWLKSRSGITKIGCVDSAAFSTKGKHKKGANGVVENKYSKTVLLPTTNFEQRANAVHKEPEIQSWWENNRIYEKLSETNPGDKYILHDGPPYANGDLHIGHALNKMLKDFVNRYQILQGKKVTFVPGWDCHGLPIELKVLQTIPAKERATLDAISLRKKAAEFAKQTMESQKKSFKRYGVWGDFDFPYLTLQPEYEAAQIRVFGDMVAKGHIYRGKKPVHWSPSSRTALAEAELEYPDNHISQSLYLSFPCTTLSPALHHALQQMHPSSAEGGVRVAIWTTTPWTIPANVAVAVNGALEYCLIQHPHVQNNTPLLVAKGLVETLTTKLGLPVGESWHTSTGIRGEELVGTQYTHPLYPDRIAPIVVGGDYITTESGTGLVHTAPGHGQEDFVTGTTYQLPILCPVDDYGRFTEEVKDPRFVGKEVLGDGNTAVIDALRGIPHVLLAQDAYPHKYPYDWRTKKPTIVRTTEQWFASVTAFRAAALEAIETVQWIPLVGKNRIAAMTSSRGDWCISRQRVWGVPIPVFYHRITGEVLMNAETLQHIEAVFRQHGSDAWWEMSVEDLLPATFRAQAGDYVKGTDTMDVWFDSGTSWAGVLQARSNSTDTSSSSSSSAGRNITLRYPADLYLEGSDQSRGWFQSSLLTSVASQGQAPYRTVLTHGFVLDEKGMKMSKSLGNVIDPMIVIQGSNNNAKEQPAYGADVLRLWVASVDYAGDVCIGKNILAQVAESYRKYRNTIRFLLGSLHGFQPDSERVPYDQLAEVDKYILGQCSTMIAEVQQAYANS